MLVSRKPYLQTHEVAGLFGVKIERVYGWLRQGKISEPDRDPINGYRMWSEEDVQAIRDYLTGRMARRVLRRAS